MIIKDNMDSFACKFAQELRKKYSLTYACSVGLEGSINSMLHYGLGEEPIHDVLIDIMETVEFTEEKELE